MLSVYHRKQPLQSRGKIKEILVALHVHDGMSLAHIVNCCKFEYNRAYVGSFQQAPDGATVWYNPPQ